MPRTIPELRAAVAAGDTLSPHERARLDAHQQESSRAVIEMMRAGYVPDTSVRAWIERDLATADGPALRQKILWLLALLEFHDHFVAQQAGAYSRERRHRQNAGRRRAAQRRTKSGELLIKIDALKAKAITALTDTAAARRHLRDTPEWASATEEERKRLAAALTRRISRARRLKSSRKKRGH